MKSSIIVLLFTLTSHLPAYTQECEVSGGVINFYNYYENFCISIDPYPFTEYIAATGSGTLSYQWQISTDHYPNSLTFTDIPGATGVLYDPAVIFVDTHYRRITTNTINGVFCTAESSIVSFWSARASIGSLHHPPGDTVITICKDEGIYLKPTSPSIPWAHSYQWQQSQDNITFTNIGYEDRGPDYSHRMVTQKTYYRRLNGSCSSNVITVLVRETTGGTIAGNQMICSGGSGVPFTEVTPSTGSGTITYQWEWGAWVTLPGATGNSHTPTSTGNYRRITISTHNGLICAARSNIVTVSAALSHSGSINASQTVCQGGNPTVIANFGSPSGSATMSFQWQSSTDNISFTDVSGATGTTYDPPAGLATTTYYRRKVITDPLGCIGYSNTHTVSVNSVNGGSISANQTSCGGFDPAAFTQSVAATGAGTLSYQWQSSTDNVTFSNISGATATTYDPPAGLTTTRYYKRITSSTLSSVSCTSASNTITVTVNPVPTATITPATTTTFCQGGSVTLNANTGSGLTYQWKLGGTNISGATASSYSATQSGSYTVVVTNSSSCSTTSSATTVTVNAVPAATVTPASASFCTGGSVTLNANTSSGLTYQWKLGGSNISGATSSSYTATGAGNYSVVVTNSSSCSATSNVVTVTVLSPAPVTISSQSSTICEGYNVLLTTSLNANVASYQWKRNGTNISGATSSTYSAQLAGSYTVTTVSISGCSHTSSALVITVTATPEPYIMPSQDFCPYGFTNLQAYNVNDATSFSWSNGDGGNPIGVFLPGNYTVTAYYGSCYATSQIFTIEPCDNGPCDPGFECPGGDMAVSEMYPNKADRQVNVRLSKAPETNITYSVYNQFGVAVKRGTFNKGESMSTIETTDLANGLYILHVQTSTGTIREKLMVSHE